jgi:uncharacterized protein (TIGR02687 family)
MNPTANSPSTELSEDSASPSQQMRATVRYRADITAGSLKIAESRVIADLLLRGVDEVLWKQATVKDNVLKARNPETARRLARLIRQRLETMSAELWRMVRDGTTVVATHALLAAAVSLLPHQTLAYKPTGEVLVDGKPSSSLPQRDEILAAVEGVAVKGEDLMAMSRDAGREFIREKMVVYVYHNTVDATGDYAPTEGKTFEAVRKAIDEIASLVGHIINNLNGSQVVITADHGFLFQESAPEPTDKSALEEKPNGTVITKKRYLLGHKLPEHDCAWHGFTATTASTEGDMEFWIPKGVNRFHFTGGARFIHGGAMLQEVVAGD